MGRVESKTAKAETAPGKPDPGPSGGVRSVADDQAALIKAMMQAMESLTNSLTDKVTAAITDLKSSLANERRQEVPLASPDDYARPDKIHRSEFSHGLSFDRPSYGFGGGPAPGIGKIQLERYTGVGTKTLPSNWIRSYETMASLQQWTNQHKITMLRFYLADEAVTWFDNQMSQGMGTMSWNEIKARFEKYFNQDKVVTPKAVLTKEWDPKSSSFYEHYKEMLRLFEISGIQESWRIKVLKTSLPAYYARMCSGVETDDVDEWYQRAANIISSLPKFDAKTGVKSPVKTVAAVDLKSLAKRAPVDMHDKTDDPSKCIFCCQINPNHKLEDCFCHPRKLRAAIGRRNINVLEESDDANDEGTEDVLRESDLDDEDESGELNVLTKVLSNMGSANPVAKDTISVLDGVSNRAKMTINNIATVEGLIDSGASVSAISENLCLEWDICYKSHKKDLASVQGPFSTKGVVFVNVQIGPYQSKVKAYVLESPPYPFILGINEFKTFGVAWTYPYLIHEKAGDSVAQLKEPGRNENQ